MSFHNNVIIQDKFVHVNTMQYYITSQTAFLLLLVFY